MIITRSKSTKVKAKSKDSKDVEEADSICREVRLSMANLVSIEGNQTVFKFAKDGVNVTLTKDVKQYKSIADMAF